MAISWRRQKMNSEWVWSSRSGRRRRRGTGGGGGGGGGSARHPGGRRRGSFWDWMRTTKTNKWLIYLYRAATVWHTPPRNIKNVSTNIVNRDDDDDDGNGGTRPEGNSILYQLSFMFESTMVDPLRSIKRGNVFRGVETWENIWGWRMIRFSKGNNSWGDAMTRGLNVKEGTDNPLLNLNQINEYDWTLSYNLYLEESNFLAKSSSSSGKR